MSKCANPPQSTNLWAHHHTLSKTIDLPTFLNDLDDMPWPDLFRDDGDPAEYRHRLLDGFGPVPGGISEGVLEEPKSMSPALDSTSSKNDDDADGEYDIGDFRCTKSPCGGASFPNKTALAFHNTQTHARPRPYHCVFDFAGCDSTFSGKGEWRRHVYRHIRIRYWVCQKGRCARRTKHTRAYIASRQRGQVH